MGYFPVRYDSRVIIYERKMFIRLATACDLQHPIKMMYFRVEKLFKFEISL